jgi:hypothetical protein
LAEQRSVEDKIDELTKLVETIAEDVVGIDERLRELEGASSLSSTTPSRPAKRSLAMVTYCYSSADLVRERRTLST